MVMINWWPKLIPEEEAAPHAVPNPLVVVEGFKINNGETDGVLWHSSVISKRESSSVLTSKSGTTYILRGSINAAAARREGFSEVFIAKFALGFPENWWAEMISASLLMQGAVVKKPVNGGGRGLHKEVLVSEAAAHPAASAKPAGGATSDVKANVSRAAAAPRRRAAVKVVASTSGSDGWGAEDDESSGASDRADNTVGGNDASGGVKTRAVAPKKAAAAASASSKKKVSKEGKAAAGRAAQTRSTEAAMKEEQGEAGGANSKSKTKGSNTRTAGGKPTATPRPRPKATSAADADTEPELEDGSQEAENGLGRFIRIARTTVDSSGREVPVILTDDGNDDEVSSGKTKKGSGKKAAKVQTSRSGRARIPRLEYWRNETVVHDRDGTALGIHAGSPASAEFTGNRQPKTPSSIRSGKAARSRRAPPARPSRQVNESVIKTPRKTQPIKDQQDSSSTSEVRAGEDGRRDLRSRKEGSGSEAGSAITREADPPPKNIGDVLVTQPNDGSATTATTDLPSAPKPSTVSGSKAPTNKKIPPGPIDHANRFGRTRKPAQRFSPDTSSVRGPVRSKNKSRSGSMSHSGGSSVTSDDAFEAERARELALNIWRQDEVARFNRAMDAVPPTASDYWTRIAAIVGTRDASACVAFQKSRDRTPARDRRGAKRKAAQEKDSKDVADILDEAARAGPVKKQKLFRAYLERQDAVHVDDIFEDGAEGSAVAKMTPVGFQRTRRVLDEVDAALVTATRSSLLDADGVDDSNDGSDVDDARHDGGNGGGAGGREVDDVTGIRAISRDQAENYVRRLKKSGMHNVGTASAAGATGENGGARKAKPATSPESLNRRAAKVLSKENPLQRGDDEDIDDGEEHAQAHGYYFSEIDE